MRLRTFTILVFMPAVMPALAQSDLVAGARSYEVCAGCHGFLGEGNEIIGAPRLSGIETWYLERQIGNFKDGRRGHVEGDADGRRMALMAQAVDNERELGDLMAWIGSLPSPADSAPVSSQQAMTAEIARGQELYALCSACHGAEGQGNEALGAPALVPLDDWYFTEQLELYAQGLRGTHPADTYGAQMRALAASFDTEEERRNLASYVMSLDPG